MNTLSGYQAGLLLHPTSLPSGRLDSDALRWIDWLSEAGFSVWQVLPLGVTQENHSPYMCLSSFAMNPALMAEPEIDDAAQTLDLADFLYWYRRQQHWLDDYALFSVLKQTHAGQAWYQWPAEYRQREPQALDRLRQAQQDALKAVFLQQYALHARWQSIRDYARQRGVSLLGDLPIFVAHDSADVWANQDCFLLDEHGQPRYVAGVPPDYFSTTGQRWGNPQYDWAALQAGDFAYWVERLGYHIEHFDAVRIDHFRGLESSWMIDATEAGAMHGHWQTVPGAALLETVRKELGSLPLVAENLGTITPEVEALRQQFNLPGMAVLQFAWDGSLDNPHLPHNIQADCVAYTGTHDNDTTLGWFESLVPEIQHKIMQHMGITQADQVCDSMIDATLSSAAQLAMIPLQDVLELGSTARMNTPGTDLGNWAWQADFSALTTELASRYRARLNNFDRRGDSHE